MPPTFRFLDLPRELRLMVYEHLPLKAHRISRGTKGTGIVAYNIDTSILLVCKCIHAEAKPILYALLKKHHNDLVSGELMSSVTHVDLNSRQTLVCMNADLLLHAKQPVRFVLDWSDFFSSFLVASVLDAYSKAQASFNRTVDAGDVVLPQHRRIDGAKLRPVYTAFVKQSADYLVQIHESLTDLHVVIIDQRGFIHHDLENKFVELLTELGVYLARLNEAGKSISVAISVKGRIRGSSAEMPKCFVDNEVLETFLGLGGIESVKCVEQPGDDEWDAIWGGNILAR